MVVFGIGAALQVQVFEDRVNEVWLHQHDGTVLLVLDLYAQKVAAAALIIDSKRAGAGTQVCDKLINSVTARSKNDAVVNIDQKQDEPM